MRQEGQQNRALPWEPLLQAIGEERLVEIRDAIAATGTTAPDRDAFLLDGTVGRLLQELVPEEAPPDSLQAWGALLHAVYLAWTHGWPVAAVSEPALRRGVGGGALPEPRLAPGEAIYVQLPPRIAWAAGSPGAPHEPLDGMFLIREAAGIRVVAVLGLHPSRDGYTTMEAALELPARFPAARSDGSAPFTSVLPAGERAGLLSVTDEHELAALALLAADAAGR